MTTPVVTATRAGRGQKVEVHLDGKPWRALPVGAAAAAGLRVGVVLDRERARLLNRALRRQKALDTAGRILRASDQTRATLSERLARSGVGERERVAAVETLVTASIVDDGRFARDRAQALARRDMGDRGIRADLEARGIANALILVALGDLEPEDARVARILGRDGVSQRTVQRLSRRGFCEPSLEAAVVQLDEDANAAGTTLDVAHELESP